MSTFDVEPGARVLWCLRRRASDVRCVLYATGVPVEVRIVQDRDLVLKEIFPSEPFATAWADEVLPAAATARLAAPSRRLFPLVCRLTYTDRRQRTRA